MPIARHRRRHRPVLAAIGGLIAAIAIGAGTRAAATDREIVLSVAGRSNATPWIAASGRFIAVAWGATTSEGKTDVFIATSRNAGRTFGAPVQVNTQAGEAHLGGEMPPRIAIAATASYGGPDVAVLWTARGDATVIKLARSRDGGHFFGQPITLQSADAAGDRGWPSMTLDDHGVAHAIWLDHRGMAGASHAGHAGHAAGSAGAAGGAGSAGGATPPRDGAAMAQRSGLYYAAAQPSQSDAAVTAVPERELTKGVCYCCKTSLVAGRDGALFAAWRQVYPGNLRDIAFSLSRDGGRTFTAPTPISRDGWAIDGCPDDGPAMAVDASGTVHVVWPTVVGGAAAGASAADAAEPQGALFYTTTRDGRTFTARTRIPTLGSAKPSHPQIAIDHTGRIIIAWDEIANGQRVAAARELHIANANANANAAAGAGTPTFGPILTLGSGTAAMYPVLAFTSDGLIAAWTSGATGASTIKISKVD
jgi:hypothetical protein